MQDNVKWFTSLQEIIEKENILREYMTVREKENNISCTKKL